MTKPIYQLVRETHAEYGLQAVFRDILGWDSQKNDIEIFQVRGVDVRGTKIASMFKGVGVFRFEFPSSTSVPAQFQNEISKAVGAKYAERLVIIETDSNSTWLWPKRTSGGSLTHEKFTTAKSSMPVFLAQRLAGLRFSSTDALSGISISELRERLRGSFDTSNVTKKFFDRFKSQHESLANAISGLSKDDRGSYATLLLNRLMFLYFLQKKEFLNSDPNYLENCLSKVKSLNSATSFYSFYKDLLLVLFFDVLNDARQACDDPEIAEIIGQVPYVNGGIFGQSKAEFEANISIPDEVFVEIFAFFNSFSWHLDTRPTGKPDEINPEVIGFIFEQYINFTAGGKKVNGAYYTKSDVTGYMASQTLVPRIFDLVIECGLNPLMLLPGSGTRYINESSLTGWDSDCDAWKAAPIETVECWKGDPSRWGELDALAPDPELLLPGESWVEMFHRRDIIDALRSKICLAEIDSIEEIITTNLNSHLLLLDALGTIDNHADFHAVWAGLEKISVIDPTCGSGAFLFAALEVLETVYSTLIDVAEELSARSAFASKVMTSVATHPNRRYFIRKKAALNNIYGTDLMPDAVETAKLRVFLALASCLDSTGDIEPLPDLDFNIKVGNLLVGIKDEPDISRIAGNDLTAQFSLAGLEPRLNEYVGNYARFVNDSESKLGIRAADKAMLKEQNRTIVDLCDRALASMTYVPEQEFESWKQRTKPFHWFAEFPQVFGQGGFDVIIGNPPYIKARDFSASDSKELLGYQTIPFRDIYEVCFERTLGLLSPKGRHGLIIMSSIARGDDYRVIREIIGKSYRSEWWSTYSIRPASLFTGVKVRNAILILGPQGTRNTFSTRNNVFTTQTRAWLFDRLEYYQIERSPIQAPLRGGVANGLATDLAALAQGEGPRSKKTLYMRNSGKYWYPILLGESKVFNPELEVLGNDSVAKRAQLYDFELESNAISICAGKLGFFSWSLVGDDFNVSESQTAGLRRTLKTTECNEKLRDAGVAVVEAGAGQVILSEYRGNLYPNVNWTAARSATDTFDREYLQFMGLLQHWRPLNIWYRQVMKVTREDNQRVKLSRGQALQLLGWP